MITFNKKILFQAEDNKSTGIFSGDILKGGMLDKKISTDSLAGAIVGNEKSKAIEDDILNEMVGRNMEDDVNENLPKIVDMQDSSASEDIFDLETEALEQVEIKSSAEIEYGDANVEEIKIGEISDSEIIENETLPDESLKIENELNDDDSAKEMQRNLAILKNLQKEIQNIVEKLRGATLILPENEKSFETKTDRIIDRSQIQKEVQTDGLRPESLEIERTKLVSKADVVINNLQNHEEKEDEEEIKRKRQENIEAEYYDDIRTAKYEARQKEQFAKAFGFGRFEVELSAIHDLNQKIDVVKQVMNLLNSSMDALNKVTSGQSLNQEEKENFMNLYTEMGTQKSNSGQFTDVDFKRAVYEVSHSSDLALEMQHFCVKGLERCVEQINQYLEELAIETEEQTSSVIDADDKLPEDVSKDLPSIGKSSFLSREINRQNNSVKDYGRSLPGLGG